MKQQRLMERYLSGSATAEEVRRLDEALAHNAELRREFGLRAEIDSHLRQMSRQVPVALKEQTVGRGSQSLDRASESTRTRLMAIRPRYAFFVAVLAASILLAVVLQLPRSGIVDATSVPRLGNRMHLVSCVTNPQDDLWSAARDGDVAAVNRALHRGVRVDARLKERDLTPLHIAALFGRIDVAEVLLDAGADISLTDVEGNTALHMAAFVAERDVVELLLNRGASVRARNGLGFTSMDLASATWNPELEEIYSQLGAAMGTRLDLDRIKAAQPNIIVLFLPYTSMLDADASSPQPPAMNIWEAAAKGNVSAIQQHVAAGTFLDGKEPVGGSTPLILAAIFGQPEAATALLEGGANLEIKNNSGSTALYAASFFCQPDVVRVLLGHNAEMQARNQDGLNAFEAVSIPWNAELASVYRFVYQSLGIEYSEDRIRRIRTEVAELLSQSSR